MLKINNLNLTNIILLQEQLKEINSQVEEIKKDGLKSQWVYHIGARTHYTIKVNNKNIIVEVLSPQC